MKRSTLLGSLVIMSMAGCGGGGGGGSPTPQATGASPTGASPTNLTATGVITGFSSVFVSGERYEVEDDTIVAIEGQPERLGDDGVLQLGMKVKVSARESSGQRIADRIYYDNDLKGPVENLAVDALNPTLGRFSLLRQTVVVDANTIFDDDVGDNNADGNIDIRDLALATGEMVVEVSGLLVTDGFIATRIERISGAAGLPGVDDDEFEIKGFVDEVAADGTAFRINDANFIVIEGAGGTFFDDGLVANETLVGQYVEVEADRDAGGNLIAVQVELEDDLFDRDGDGRIDDGDRDGRFEITGILASVDTSVTPNVVMIGESTFQVADASNLVGQIGRLLEIEGSFDANGVLVLSEIEVESENSIGLEDLVAEVGESTFTTRLGLTVTPTGISRVSDDVSDDREDDHLTPAEFLARLQLNDAIEARAFVDENNSPVWTRIERVDEDDQDCVLRGPVASIEGTAASDFSFVIEGVIIDVSQIVSDSEFEGVNEQAIGRQAFFDQLSVGDVVEAESDSNGLGCELGRLTAGEVEFELEDGVVGSNPVGNAGVLQELSGTPSAVTDSSFVLASRTIVVIGSTLIDGSLIEAALSREIDSEYVPFDQIPAGLTLADLLTGTIAIEVTVNADGIATEIEDL